MVKFFILNGALTTLSVLSLMGCGSKKYSDVANNIINRTWTPGKQSPLEKTYCNNTIVHNSSYLISGQATYEYRPIGTDPSNEGLLDIAEDTRPIRHAQYDVMDVSGKILQCGETDGNGNFSFKVPQSRKALSLNIYARSNNSHNKASVFIAPETNELHKIQYFFTSNNNQSNINLVAEGDKSLIGGAFNILDQIHNSFDTLKASLTGQGTDPLDIPKVDIYWEKGFNPSIYIGSSSRLSFLSRPQMKIFILGGSNGDVDFTDTDHFDNSIILHEYFHFLESAISVNHSPGGPHNGNQILDPRSAWSEGAAQFYQAFITNIPTVLDTRGNSDGSTGFRLKLSVENEGSDSPIHKGEGEFREFAVARLLWDMHDTEFNEAASEEDFDNVSGYFPEFWQAFSSTGSQIGFNNSKAHLASLGLLLESIDSLTPIRDDSNWNRLLTHSFMTQPISTPVGTFRAQYGQGLRRGNTTASFSFKKPYTSQVYPYLPDNHPLLSIDYYTLTVAALNVETISITSTTTGHMPGKEGHVKFHVFKNTYQDLTESIFGPISEDTTLDLNGGPNGTTYMIAVVISTLPEEDPSLNTLSINYEFPGFEKENF